MGKSYNFFSFDKVEIAFILEVLVQLLSWRRRIIFQIIFFWNFDISCSIFKKIIVSDESWGRNHLSPQTQNETKRLSSSFLCFSSCFENRWFQILKDSKIFSQIYTTMHWTFTETDSKIIVVWNVIWRTIFSILDRCILAHNFQHWFYQVLK